MDIKDIQKALKTGVKPKKDECGDWNLFGKFGKIFVDNTYWYVYVSEGRLKHIKEQLKFMTITQEGDYEIILRSSELPKSTQATKIRKIIGLKAKRVLSPEHREKLVEAGIKTRLQKGSK